MKNVINGIIFEKMILNGLNNLINHEREINVMNVFPVADGDTGTNMRLTLENGYKKAQHNEHLGLYLKELSAGMLLGARGNSGVILSQLFKGIAQSLARCSIANPREIKESLILAYQTAYQAVINPVEGTILTVAREGIEHTKDQVFGKVKIDTVFAMYLAEMRVSLEKTPTILPVLKEAGVLDSGAYGYIIIIEGMLKALLGEKIETGLEEIKKQEETPSSVFFDENSEFNEGYCMEFLLQLMNSKNYRQTFNFDAFVDSLKQLGNSIVALREGTIIKVHIHTLVPGQVMEIAREYGEFVSFKLENMQVQHNEYIYKQKQEKKLDHKPLQIIAVVDGEGIESLYKEMGCDIVLQGGQTMNTSSEEFVYAINRTDADDVIIFPNNKNILEAARQAVSVSEAKNVTIIPTETVLEGYYALAMDLPDMDNETRIDSLRSGAEGIVSISIGDAIKEYKDKEFSCSIGDKVGILNGKMVGAAKSIKETLDILLSKIEDIEDKAGIIVFKGESCSQNIEKDITNLINEKYDHLDVQIFEGDEHIYDVLIGVI